MDKNQATGLLLFAGVLLIYSLFFASGPESLPQEEAVEQIVQNTPDVQPQRGVPEVEGDSLSQVKLQQQFGVFASAAQGEERIVVLENEDIVVTFSSKGGEIQRVQLKEFKTWEMEPLYLIEEGFTSFSYQLPGKNGPVDLNDLYFSVEEGAGSVVFIARTGAGSVRRTYTLGASGFELQHNIQVQNLAGELTGQSIQLEWDARLKRLEEDLEESRRKTYMNYYTSDGSYDYLTTGNSEDEAQVSKPLHWVAFKQRFFTAGVIADESFAGGTLTQSTDETDTNLEKSMSASLSLPLQGGAASLRYYFGPNNYNILRKVAPDFDKNVDMGYFFVSWVNKYIIVNLFHFLEKYFANYGVIIILIVFIIKLFLLPLTYKSYIGMAKMRVIKPEIDELKEKYGEDPAKMQQEQMKLFGQLGVSPISGCLPMVLQMPFLLAMFFFFPNSIELRQESFLWAHDLSTYDTFIKLPFTIPFYGAHVSLFTLLMTISQIAYTHFNNQLTTAQGPMKNIGYIMPVVFMFVLNSFPAALSFYYFVSNMVTFGQQALIKQFVDDDKIREKVEETKLKNANKKKSKFQLKLEEAMKNADAKKKKK
ncbi:MAG: membrane protein insertase YidC [Lunatimonas sp.]|uniref:membrane protein insertase YidC n=1 Tax=Lunatimonas sp. TaxID=2060141 RepID=UPI00263B36DB|nr:membrane protein insertase YidC [Lunatimonas sp.]MCC5937659.1 membrane protein insertase YidC [Lunatimonas sp.]